MAATKVIRPQPGPQEQFLATSADIAIYGGAAGGGKTWGLLMEPLRHINVPDFGAVFFRRSTVQIRNEGGLWDESAKLYPDLGGAPKEHVLTWDFPAGTSVSFAHLEHDKTVHNWQGSQIPLICFDELTHFSAKQFWYMVSRNRSMCGVRPYIRATCNPDCDSWVADLISWWIDPNTGLPIRERGGVLRWFIRLNDKLIWGDSKEELLALYPEVPPKSLTFIPASLTDNAALMAADPGYVANLMALPLIERERLLGGNWKIKNTETLVFKNWRKVEFDTPLDAVLRFGADWGFSVDPTVLVRMFIGRWQDGKAVSDPTGRVLFIDHEAYKVGCEIDETPSLFAGTDREDPPRWSNNHNHPGIPGAKKWLITADSSRPETVSYMKRKGFRIAPAIKGPGSVEDGIEFLKTYDIVVHPRCVETALEFGAYSFKVDEKTGEVLPLLEDKDNHVIDACRYACEAVRRAKKPTVPNRPKTPSDYRRNEQPGGSEWMAA